MDELTFDGSVRLDLRSEDGTARCWALARTFLLGLSLALACQCALAQAMYRIKTLGYLGGCTSSAPRVAGLNQVDEVAGTACNANGDSHAYLWKNNGKPMVDLGPLEVGSTSQAYALTASGLVAGSASDSSGIFAFESRGGGTPMTRIYNGLGGTQIEAYAVNDSGQLTGYATLAGDNFEHAFFWKNDGSLMVDLGSASYLNSSGAAINASGQVGGSVFEDAYASAFVWKNNGSSLVDLNTQDIACCINASGQVAGGERFQAFLWNGASVQNLGALRSGWRSARALNDSGQVAGSSYPFSRTKSLAFVWLNDGTPIKNLGTLGGTSSQSNEINASGQVTGWANTAGDAAVHAFLWRNDGTKIQDLNKLIDPSDPLKPYVTLTNGAFINDLGDIVADGTDSRTRASDVYLLRGTVLTLAPRSLAFGNRPINTTNAAKSVTMTNTSPKVVAITSIALMGSGSREFASTSNCGSSLLGHATCTIKVTFKPATKGAKSATLNVNGGGGGLRSVSLTGTGT